jgi:predicted alpha/beta hydrolase
VPATNFTLTARDGTPLAATHYAPEPNADTGAFLFIGGATAVPRGFYRRFCEYAAQRGVHSVTVDFRGLADSKHGPLKGFVMDYVDWSQQDSAAALDWACARGPTWMVGHSLGGHSIGLLPEPNRLKAAFVCGTGAGWHGWMSPLEYVRTWSLWNIIGPLSVAVLGYLPTSKLGIGEDLPYGVYRDWKRWCGFPHYFFDDPAAAHLTAPFAQVRLPIAALVSTDDAWAPPKSRDAFFKGYTGTRVEPIDITPAQMNVPAVGHMGYFRASVGEVLWPRIFEWLMRHGLPAKAA